MHAGLHLGNKAFLLLMAAPQQSPKHKPRRNSRVYRVLDPTVQIDTADDQVGNIATSRYLSTDCLQDIALQLQDIGNNRLEDGGFGLDLR